MKRYRFLIGACLVFMTIVSACSLDEYNPSGISTDQEWSTAAGYEKLVNNCYYDLIRIVYGQAEDSYVFDSEAGTDLWEDVNSGTNYSKILRYEDFGATNGLLSEPYSGFYGALSACNAAIYYADKVEGLTTDQVNQLVAEAHFIRAHALMNIVELWGAKYMPTEPSSVIGTPTTLPTSTIDDFYKTILSDLEFAMTNLPASQSVYGHVRKVAAYHLYAKACLTYATYTDGLGGSTLSAAASKELLNKAKTAAEYVINNQSALGVSLYGTADEVFSDDNNKSNNEALFVVCHSMTQTLNPRGNYYNRVWKHFGAYNNNSSGIYLDGMTPSYNTEVNGYATHKLAKCNCYMAPTKYFINLYADKDTRYDAYFNDTYYVNKATNSAKNGYTWTTADAKRYNLDNSRVGNSAFNITLGDTAVYISRHTYTQAERDACRYAIYNIDDNYATATQPLKFYPSLSKADNPAYYAGTNASKPYSGSDCIVYRLAETYLLAAEVAWRLGDNITAAKYVNVIRNRACKNHDHSLDVVSGDITQDFLLDEYARELGGEWNRWYTLKRFRAFQTRIALANPQITKFDAKVHYFRPVPNSEMLLIDNDSTYQNPGY